MTEAERIIAKLGLDPLYREGGFFLRTWTSRQTDAAGRSISTAIYFMVTEADHSAVHKLDAEELWHFYAGDPVEHWQFAPGGGAQRTILGADVLNGHVPQILVPSGIWQAARLAPESKARGWSLLGCTMAPGWKQEGFELGRGELLAREFPLHADVVRSLSRL